MMARLHDLEVSVDAKLHEFHLVSQSVERVKDELRSVSREMNNDIMYASLGSRNLQMRALQEIVCDIAKSIGVNINVNDIDSSHRVSRTGDGDQHAGIVNRFRCNAQERFHGPRAINIGTFIFAQRQRGLLRSTSF